MHTVDKLMTDEEKLAEKVKLVQKILSGETLHAEDWWNLALCFGQLFFM